MATLSSLQSRSASTIFQTPILPNATAHLLELCVLCSDTQGRDLSVFIHPTTGPHLAITDLQGRVRIVMQSNLYNGLRTNEFGIPFLNKLMEIHSSCALTFVEEKGRLYIWPQMKASAWWDAIPKSHEDHKNPSRLFEGKTAEQGVEWFCKNGFKLEDDSYARSASFCMCHKSKDPSDRNNVIFTSVRDQEQVRNLLRSGHFIHSIAQNQPQRPAFQGTLSFKHPDDRMNHVFNVDYSHTVDVKPLHVSIKIANQPSKCEIEFAKELHKFEAPRAHKEFQEKTQGKGLTSSFTSCHPKTPMPPKRNAPDGHQVGGVAMHAGEIEDLFADPESLLEDEHIIAIPCADGCTTPPFSPKQLQQLLRELIIGIYDHDTVPFFSLDFNTDAHLVPLLHPIYENTLVGKVISLLDYFTGVWTKQLPSLLCNKFQMSGCFV